jgi:hypothetical protein
MKMLRLVPLLFAITGLGVLAPAVRAQSTVDSSTSASITGGSRSPTIKHPQPDLVYRCPTEKAKLRTYFFVRHFRERKPPAPRTAEDKL